ncbi:hypothetical protein [Blastopirellula sediminis]|nr:hypothetical protein [Blastopirellula sediminis]
MSHRLKENMAAAELELSDAELAEINEGAAEIQAVGARYSEAA